jgi:hypothetical protein
VDRQNYSIAINALEKICDYQRDHLLARIYCFPVIRIAEAALLEILGNVVGENISALRIELDETYYFRILKKIRDLESKGE